MILDLSDMDQHSFDIAQRFVAAKFPDAECAFVAGSLMRGEGKPHSDIDLVVLYGPDFMAVRREAHVFKGVLIDVFLHNEQAQRQGCSPRRVCLAVHDRRGTRHRQGRSFGGKA